MKILREFLICALLAAMAAAMVCAISFIREATASVAALPAALCATRAVLLDEIRSARKDVLVRSERQLTALRKDVLAEAGEVRQTADRRVGDTLARADAALDTVESLRRTADRRVGDTLARADVALDTVESLRRDLRPVLDAAQQTIRDTDRTVADLHPQLLGLVAASKVTAGETAQTMRDFRGAVPGFLSQGQAIADNAQKATKDFSGVAANLNRLTKPKWYDRLLGYGLNGIMIYRNLNPATNLTVKGAQLLTAHP